MDYKQCLEEAKRVIEADIEYDVPFEVSLYFHYMNGKAGAKAKEQLLEGSFLKR